MKNKFLYINLAVGLLLFIITGLITALIIALPINLTDEEISYYTETAENVWYNGLHSVTPDDDIVIKYDLELKTVHVSNRDTTKESIIVDFSKNESNVIINKPVASFWGCFFFYGMMWTIVITLFSSVIFNFIQNNKSKRESRD